MTDSGLPEGAEALLARTGFGSPAAISRLVGGKNNQVFAVTDADGRKLVLKAYYFDQSDSRDRLAAEHDFLTAAARLGVTCVARVLGYDSAHRLGLYSHLEGSYPVEGDVTPLAVEQGLRFVLALNDRGDRGVLPPLPFASEACHTSMAHFEGVNRRLARLLSKPGSTAIEKDANAFLRDEVLPLWERMREGALRALRFLNVEPSAAISRDDMLLSPSDFGFHNALKKSDGTFAFLDFEYAGWDDPAKLIGDAFNQVRLPLPASEYERFRDAIAAWSRQPEEEARRYDIIRPSYAIRWIAILLNEFLPEGILRRTFADQERPLSESRAVQLTKARAKFAGLVDELKL